MALLSRATPIMAQKEEIGLFFDGANTVLAYLNICDLCEAVPNEDGTDSDQPRLLYSLGLDWRRRIALRVMEDILDNYPQRDKLHDLLVLKDSFKLVHRMKNGIDENCNRASGFRRKMATVIGTNTTFCVAIRLKEDHMADLGLKYREHFQYPNKFGLSPGSSTVTTSHVGTQAPHQHNAPVPAPTSWT
jgi:hypothetical protein